MTVPMTLLEKGRYRARFARDLEDLQAAQALRYRCFQMGADPDGRDVDDFDALCRHVLVEEAATGRLVCCFRLMPLSGGPEILRSYSAQYYELSALEQFQGPIAEIGRFCLAPDVRDADVLRVAWGAMAAYVDAEGVELLFGCSSFAGIEAEGYKDAFDMLAARHLAPKRWLPRAKAPKILRFAKGLGGPVDVKSAMLRMPPLLKTYLMMGGWVSDHAVVDTQMNTLHVFTGVEIAAIPPARARALRAVAG